MLPTNKKLKDFGKQSISRCFKTRTWSNKLLIQNTKTIVAQLVAQFILLNYK